MLQFCWYGVEDTDKYPVFFLYFWLMCTIIVCFCSESMPKYVNLPQDIIDL